MSRIPLGINSAIITDGGHIKMSWLQVVVLIALFLGSVILAFLWVDTWNTKMILNALIPLMG